MAIKRWQAEELKARVVAICRAGGIPDADAGMIAEVLVTTDMRASIRTGWCVSPVTWTAYARAA